MRVKVRTTKHKKILQQAKGYRLSRSKHFRKAKESVLHAGQHAYIGRKLRKRDKRREWITQINAALTPHQLSYSKFIKLLKDKKVELDRKILAQLAKEDPATFNFIVEQLQKSAPKD
jgi:large subunit ribosomal protein L20